MILSLRNIQHHEDLVTKQVEEIKSFHKKISHETDHNTDQKSIYVQELQELRRNSHKQANGDIDNIEEEENNVKSLVPEIQVK